MVCLCDDWKEAGAESMCGGGRGLDVRVCEQRPKEKERDDRRE
jgi:hypothetical protein